MSETPKIVSREKSGKNENPRPLNLSEKATVKNKISVGAGLMFNTLVLIDGTSIGQAYIEPHLHDILKSTAAKQRELSDIRTCLTSTPNGMTLVEITREIPIKAQSDSSLLPKFISINFENYSVQCTFVPKFESSMQAESAAHNEMYTSPSPRHESVTEKKKQPHQKTNQHPTPRQKPPPQVDWRKDIFNN